MEKIKKIRTGYIVFLLISLVLIFVLTLHTPTVVPEKEEEPEAEPVLPEAPKLSAMTVEGESIVFSPDVFYYEVELAEGNPRIPRVGAETSDENTEISIYQAYFAKGAGEASAKVFLENEDGRSTYEVKFKKNVNKGFVLQYDDRYTFTPGYTLKEGEKFTFKAESEAKNVSVDENGVIRAVGVADTPSTVYAYLGEYQVGSVTVTKTEKAIIDMFIVAGQGNAAGEGGDVALSIKPLLGTVYTAELDDRSYAMRDMSAGRKGFTPAFAEKWHSLTGNKTLFVQTALSEVSVTQWTESGEAYAMAKKHIDHYKGMLTAEDSFYELNKVFCVWLHGEWDIAQGMTSDDYMKHFTNFYEALKRDYSPEMTAIIPVRSSLLNNSTLKIEPVCAAQYMLCNRYEDLRIITRLTETASIENGFLNEDDLYYNQNGYNSIGVDAAENLFNCFSAETDKTVKSIEVYGNTHEEKLENGQKVIVNKDEYIRTVAVVSPLYAEKTTVNVYCDNNELNYTDGGLIGISENNKDGKDSNIDFCCGDVKVSIVVQVAYENNGFSGEKMSYVWDFDSYGSTEGENGFAVSARSEADGIVLDGGILTAKNRSADLVFEKAVELYSTKDWYIEWNGKISDNGILLGKEYSTKGYIYLAPFADNMGNSIRLVDNDGKTFYLPYEDTAESTKEMNCWKITYIKQTETLVLSRNGKVISQCETDGEFSFTFTNLLGRYGSENVNYCYTGSLDNLKIRMG